MAIIAKGGLLKTIALIIAVIVAVPLGLLVLWVAETRHNRKDKP